MKQLVYWDDSGFYMKKGDLLGQRIEMYFTDDSIKVSEGKLSAGLKKAMAGLFKGNKIKEEYMDIPEQLLFDIPYNDITRVTTTNEFAAGLALIFTLKDSSELTFTSSKMSEPKRYVKTIQYLAEFLYNKNSSIEFIATHQDGYWYN